MKRQLSVILCLGFGLAACADGSIDVAGIPSNRRSPTENVHIIRLDETNIARLTGGQFSVKSSVPPENDRWEYKLGKGDVINIIVFDHPELTSIASSGLASGDQTPGVLATFIVQADGTFFYPYVGKLKASGRTPEELRRDLTEKLASYIASPQIEIRVAEFNSQEVVVTGEVGQAKSISMTQKPMRLLDAINAAGGLTENSDPTIVKFQRHGAVYDVNLSAFLNAGERQSNPLLQSGDVITVQRLPIKEAYVLGSVASPSVVNLAQGPITLTQAVSRQGGLNEQRADARGLFVFRREAGELTAYQLDVSVPSGWLLGNEFLLQSGDIIYATRSPLSKWNDTVSRLLPSVSAAESVRSAVPKF